MLRSNWGQVWWYTSIILAIGKLRQEDCKFEVSLGYKANPVSEMK
jgi:hypothetical protein